MNQDPTMTFDLERLKMNQDNLKNEVNYLRRQIVKLNIKLIEHERIYMDDRDRLRLRTYKRINDV
jgi:hypothetical protein